jgi:CheY-like chemotaxis protein
MTDEVRSRIFEPLYTSGYAEGILADQGVVGGADKLVQKPFTAESLLQAIRRALARSNREVVSG